MRSNLSLSSYAVMMMTVLSTMPAFAQDPRTPLPSDTTRILRGFSDFSRYRTPGMCYATVQTLTKRVRRAWAKDTVPAAEQLRWALPTAAVDAGKQCARRFTVANTRPSELQNLELLALAIGDDTLAASVVQRRLALARTLRDTGEVLEHSVTALIEAEPARRDQAIATLARLEQLGAKAGVSSLRANWSVLWRLSMGFDAPTQRRIAAAAIANARKMSLPDRDEFAREIQAVWTMYLQALMFESFDSIPAAGVQMMQDMASIRNGTYADFSTMFREMFATQIFPYLGKPLVNFTTEASYLIPSSPAMELRMGQLPQGRVHMVIVVDEPNEQIQGLIRRMHGKYGNQGLSIVLINGTKGFTKWNASGVLTPTEEAESLRTLAMDHLKLPVTFLVEDVPFQVIPDGRKQYGRTQWQTRLPASTSIIGRDGKLDMAFIWAGESEIEAYVKRAIEKSLHGPVGAGVESKPVQ